MNKATATADELNSETRLRVVRCSHREQLEAEALEVLAQLEVLQELMQRRLEDGDTASGAPAIALQAMVRKLRNALP
jgi:hypothetical protein